MQVRTGGGVEQHTRERRGGGAGRRVHRAAGDAAAAAGVARTLGLALPKRCVIWSFFSGAHHLLGF
jgi:hypothetical protein